MGFRASAGLYRLSGGAGDAGEPARGVERMLAFFVGVVLGMFSGVLLIGILAGASYADRESELYQAFQDGREAGLRAAQGQERLKMIRPAAPASP